MKLSTRLALSHIVHVLKLMPTFRTFSERVLVSQFRHKLEGLFLLVNSTRFVYTSSPKLCSASLMDLPEHRLCLPELQLCLLGLHL